MFDLLKNDIKVGDNINLHLINGKESGKVIEIGENYILLESENGTKHRFFDKLIGGWEILSNNFQKEDVKNKYRLNRVAREFDVSLETIANKLKEIDVEIKVNPNTKISISNYDFLVNAFAGSKKDEIIPDLDVVIKNLINLEDKHSPITDSEIWRLFQKHSGRRIKRATVVNSRKRLGFLDSNLRRETPDIQLSETLDSNFAKSIETTIQKDEEAIAKKYIAFDELKDLALELELERYISPNAEIDRYFIQFSNGSARNEEVSEILFKEQVVVDKDLKDELKSFKRGETIPVLCNYTIVNGKTYSNFIAKPGKVSDLINKVKILISEGSFEYASKFITFLKANKVDSLLLSNLKIEIEEKSKDTSNSKIILSAKEEISTLDNEIINLIDPISIYENARKFRLKKEFDISEKLFLAVIEKNYQIDSAVKDLADQYREQGRLNEAIILVEKYFNDFEKKEQGYNFLYDLYTSSGDLVKARYTLELYVNTEFDINDQIIKRRRGKAYARLGALTLKTKDIEKAKKYFQKAEELYPNNKQLKSALSLINLDSKKINSNENEDYFDENLFDSLVYGISPFLKYALENCNYEGVPLAVKEKKVFNKRTLTDLRELIEKTKDSRPEVRAKYYLTEAKILFDIEKSDDLDFYKALAKYCNAVAKIISFEKGPIETIREYYLNAFSLIDDWSPIATQVSIYFESFYSNYSSIAKSDGVGLDKAISSISSQVYSKPFFWDSILELFICSKQATAKVLKIVYDNHELRNASLTYLNNLLNQNNLSKITIAEYIGLWKVATRKRKLEKEEIESDIKGYLKLNNIEELSNLFINKGKSNLPSFVHDLDISRINSILSICENSKQYINQTIFEDKEFYFNNIESRYNELINNIRQFPSGYSIGSILPLAIHIFNLIRNKHQETINLSKPQLEIQVEGESIIDEEKNCEIQVSIFNSPQCSKAGEIEIEIINLNNGIEGIQTFVKFNQNLRGGGEPLIAKFNVKLNDEIIKQGASDIKIKCSYKELATDNIISIVKNISISFYDSSDFNEIANPYADHAKSNIVESTKMFKGRNELINRVCDTLLTSKSKGYVIYGQKRSGKSSVLWHLENNLNLSGDAFAIYFSTGLSIAQDNNVEANLYYVILTAIERKLRKLKVSGINVPEIGRTNLKDLLANPMLIFYDRLNDIKEAFLLIEEWKNKKLILIIDEFTYIYYQIKLGNISPTFMQNWKAFVEDGGFSLVLSGQDTMTNFIQDFQNEFAMFKTERLTYIDINSARELIEEPIWDKENNRSRYTRNSVEKIIELSACSPFYIQIICNELVRFMNNKKKPVLTPADIEDVIEMLTSGFNSLTEFDFENLLSAGDKNLDEIKPEDAIEVIKQIAIQTKFIPYARREDINVFNKEKDDQIINDLIKRAVISEQLDQPKKYKIEVQLFKKWLLNHN